MNFEYKFTVNIGSKSVDCRAFTLREYKDLMHAKLKGGLKEAIEEILSTCTNATGLSKQESELLIVKLWANSIASVNTQAVYTCPCGKESLISLNMNYAQLESDSEIIYPLKNFKIKFRKPKLFEDSNVASMIANCLDCIIVGNENLKIEDLDENELNDLFSAITTDDAQKIADLLLKPTIYMAVPIQCECGKSDVYTIKGLKEFFKLL